MHEYLNIDHVSISFDTAQGPLQVLDSVDLKIREGEFVSLIGHSGCGKSTVLNIVAGLLNATAGGVLLENREVSAPGPDRAVVFQNHSLLPWLTVYDNVRLAVDQVFKKRMNRSERDAWVRHNLALVQMDHALERKPEEISGGMKQRVGIARALAMEPKVLLMDEPFGALDSLTRSHMQDSLMEIHGKLNNTVIMITHDVDEAVLLSDRIVMMTNGPSATIGEILEIDLPRPRERLRLAENPTYNHYRAEVVRFLHERHVGRRPTSAEITDGASRAPNVFPIPTPGSRDGAMNPQPEKQALRLGFVPLTDCAPLVVAQEKGFFAAQGLDVELSRESSWANIRDKTCAGLLDGAQMPAPMALKSVLDGHRCQPLVTAINLGLNGNAITVSQALHQRLAATGMLNPQSPHQSAQALKIVLAQDRAAGRTPLTFAIVYPESSHNYLLRYWLADAGIDPDRDLRLRVLPPPQVAAYLRSGLVSGFCVGEPWNSIAVAEGLGTTLLTSHDIWNHHPEKVFAVGRRWAHENPNTHVALVSALLQACRWLDQPQNREEACQLLAPGRYVNAPADLLQRSLTGKVASDASDVTSDFILFHRHAANFPWRSQAIWYLTQMLRWGQDLDGYSPDEIATAVYKPEIFRQAAAGLGIAAPRDDFKIEGSNSASWQLDGVPTAIDMGADRFMDGRVFDAADYANFLDAFQITRHRDVEAATLTNEAV